MESLNNNRSQLEIANEQLVQIEKVITAQDRQEAMLTRSFSTVVTYLKGEGKNLDTAMELLKLFRARIEKRDEFLMGQ